MARQGERDSTAEQRDDEREHRRPLVEKRRATHKKITLSAPCRKPQRKNEKLNSKFTCDLEFYYFYSDFLTLLGKKGKKNGGERGIRTLGELPLGGFQDRCLKPLDHFSASFK